jgi:GDP/UDP-N,N'-diacetylbacillosamine 2-epimerase (hydrolysing)
MMTRKIFVLSGKRGGFGAMKPMLRLLRDDPRFELMLVLTDQHVSDTFGNTIQEVSKEFAVSATVEMNQKDGSPQSRSAALATCMAGMTNVLADLDPNICVLYGDRGEVLTTATVATVMGYPIAHIQGGDVSGSADEQMRHAVTKLSQLHFPSTQKSAERIKLMGEPDKHIFVVGDNHIDLIVAGEFTPSTDIGNKLGLNLDRPIITLLQHSETTEPEAAYSQMCETLHAIRKTGEQTVVVHPCSDPGYEGIIEAINEIAVPPQFRVHINLEAPDFWGLLNISSVFIGNSSAGLIETPYLRLPAINVGRRQIGRLHAENVLHVPHVETEIKAALDTAIYDAKFRSNIDNCSQPFGDGTAGEQIVEILANVELGNSLIVKQMTY